MGCEMRENQKNHKYSQVTCSIKVKCQFNLRFALSGSGSQVTVRYDIHNHDLAKDLVGHDILGRLKPDIQLVLN